MPRQTRWIDTVVGLTGASGANAAVSLLTGVGPVDTRGVTIIRSIMRLTVVSTTVAGVWGGQNVHLGIGIAAQAAFAVGITALPTPEGTEQPSRGWVWRDHVFPTQNGVGTMIGFEVRADIRGARKIEDGEVYLVMSNVAGVGTPFTATVTGLVRLLVKLP